MYVYIYNIVIYIYAYGKPTRKELVCGTKPDCPRPGTVVSNQEIHPGPGKRESLVMLP